MKLRCSKCRKSWIDTAVGRCESCGLVLGENASVVSAPFGGEDDDSEEVTFEENSGQHHIAPSITDITGASSLRHHGVPERVPNAGAAPSLTPFEGYLLSLVDGATFVDDVIAASGLALHEAAIALQNLKEKGLIRFRESADQDAARRAPDGSLKPDVTPSSSPTLGKVGLKKVAVGTVSPLEDPAEQLRLAREEAGRGNFARAREHARLAAMIAPESQETNVLLEQLESPHHAKMRAKHLHSLGSACQKQNDFVRAVELYRAAIQEWEPSAVLHHKLAVALALAGFPMQEAEKHLVRAVSLAPHKPVYAQHLAQLRAQLQAPAPQAPQMRF